jgi:nicotinamidase/pyrazinamidase
MSLDITKVLLLLIDVQNDFCSDTEGKCGALAVPEADKVITPLNDLSSAVAGAGGWVAATQDWHPVGHISFASSHEGTKPGDIFIGATTQVLWPDHCVQGGWGACFNDKLDLKFAHLIVRKGFRIPLDSYSAFFENDRKTPTGLEGWMRGLGIRTVIIGGLATDYCVFYSAVDSKNLGFDTIIAHDAVRGVDFPAGSLDKALAEMRAAGIIFSSSQDLIKDFL